MIIILYSIGTRGRLQSCLRLKMTNPQVPRFDRIGALSSVAVPGCTDDDQVIEGSTKILTSEIPHRNKNLCKRKRKEYESRKFKRRKHCEGEFLESDIYLKNIYYYYV